MTVSLQRDGKNQQTLFTALQTLISFIGESFKVDRMFLRGDLGWCWDSLYSLWVAKCVLEVMVGNLGSLPQMQDTPFWGWEMWGRFIYLFLWNIFHYHLANLLSTARSRDSLASSSLKPNSTEGESGVYLCWLIPLRETTGVWSMDDIYSLQLRELLDLSSQIWDPLATCG